MVGPNGQYFAYVVVGIVSLSVLTAALKPAQIVRMELLTGTFERMVVSPLGPVCGVIALAAFPILYSLASRGPDAGRGQGDLWLSGPPGRDPAGARGSALRHGCVRVHRAAVRRRAARVQDRDGRRWAIAGLSILGGVYFPLKLFPGWLRWVADVQPFTPAVDLLRHLLLGTPSTQAVWLELSKLAGFTLALMPLSVIMLSNAVHLSRRRGTLMEY